MSPWAILWSSFSYLRFPRHFCIALASPEGTYLGNISGFSFSFFWVWMPHHGLVTSCTKSGAASSSPSGVPKVWDSAIPGTSEWKWKCWSLRPVWLFVTPQTVAHQDPLSMGFSRREYWNGLPSPSPGVSSQPRDQTRVSLIAGRFFTVWATREALDECIVNA